MARPGVIDRGVELHGNAFLARHRLPSQSLGPHRLSHRSPNCGPKNCGADELATDEREALAEGQALFRGLCSGCHGGAGRGGKGPDLTDSRWIHGNKDADIARVIREGVPKTTMKKLGESLKEEQIAKRRPVHPQPGPLAGREHLEAVPRRRSRGGPRSCFSTTRARPSAPSATRVKGQGGRVGPLLGPHRQPPRAGVHHGIDPAPLQGHRPQFRDGAGGHGAGAPLIKGLRINETNFNIQLREENGRFHSLLKRELEEVAVVKKSLMPENMPEVLTVKELHDLFAFLMSLE